MALTDFQRTEALGWLEDCGLEFITSTPSDHQIITRIGCCYDGGFSAFLQATATVSLVKA